MIKPNELRLSNWVNWKFPNIGYEKRGVVEQEKICQIEGIGKLVHVLGSAYTFNQIEGIPLTEDILLKAGAVVHKVVLDYSFTFKIDEYKTLTIAWNDVNKWYCYFRQTNDEDKLVGDFVLLRNDLAYLHQLQNLYNILTGEELTINL